MSAELMLAGAVGAVNDTQRQFLTTIKNNLDRMTTIVTDLNDITRIETGRMRLDLRPFDFQGLILPPVGRVAGHENGDSFGARQNFAQNLKPLVREVRRGA